VEGGVPVWTSAGHCNDLSKAINRNLPAGVEAEEMRTVLAQIGITAATLAMIAAFVVFLVVVFFALNVWILHIPVSSR
jgi:alkylhydroperoxidase/carboxymuconolactone decarboxylase family protein YurZ